MPWRAVNSRTCPARGNQLAWQNISMQPEAVHVAQAILKNAGMLPVEIELLQEMAALKELLGSTRDEPEKDKLRKSLKEKQVQFDLLLERRKR